ncbi:putative Transmembrane protein [Mycena sanguinolenta]|uniref:Putative Transmembrane protein n=1 Tax=Mycena sanguinolenta TaxID=230812 RepID=A0A8H6YXB6_9AGAR|nr:putative Transmembrane protein [Mycena sanguinolenta]
MAPQAQQNIVRIISFALAGGDVFQTIPATLGMYLRCWKNRRLTPICFFYGVARYMTIISLVTNGIGFYGTHFTLATCKPWYMLPNVTAMLAGMAVQIIVFLRTFAISGRAPVVYYGLGTVLLLGFPVQVFGIVYHRLPEVPNVRPSYFFDLSAVLTNDIGVQGECKGKVFAKGEPDWNIVYYSAHMAYDLIACATGTFYLVRSSWFQGSFNMSKFMRRVLQHGLLYFIVVFVANLWVVLEFEEVLKTGVGSTLPLAVVLIAAQHLVLSLQRPGWEASTVDNVSRTPLSAQSTRRNAVFPKRSTTATEGEESGNGVFVLTETYTEPSKQDRCSSEPDKIAKLHNVGSFA